MGSLKPEGPELPFHCLCPVSLQSVSKFRAGTWAGEGSWQCWPLRGLEFLVNLGANAINVLTRSDEPLPQGLQKVVHFFAH